MSHAQYARRRRRSLVPLALPAAAALYAACNDDPLAPRPTDAPAWRPAAAAPAPTPAGPVTGCTRLELRLRPPDAAGGSASVSVTDVPADGCGGPLRPALDTAAMFNPSSGIVRLPIVLVNESDAVLGAPARLTAWSDSITAPPSEGSALAPGAVTLGPGEANGNARDSLVWRYDDELAPEGQPQLLRPAGRTLRRWVALRVEPGVTAFRITLRATADRAPRVTFAAGRGVRGTPAGDTVVPRGTELSYRFSADSGFKNVLVTLDGEPVPELGRLRADSDRALFATADVVVTLAPEAQPLYDQARALLNASDPVAAYQRYRSAAARYASAGPRAAQQARDVEFLAFDPIRDSASLRRLDEALANHVFYAGDVAEVGTRQASATTATLAADEAARPERTLLLYVNGVFTEETWEIAASDKLEDLQREIPALNDSRVVVGHFYNRTWSSQAATQKARAAQCAARFWLQRAYMGENSLRPFLAQCMNDESYRRLSDMDLVECVRQVWSILNNTNAAEVDAIALADTIQEHRVGGQHVIVVPHSQGNLMTNQAVHRLRGGGRFDPERDSTCLAVVSLASPVSGRWDVRNDNYLAHVVVRGDPIPDLVPGANSWPRLDTELSSKITSNPLYAAAPRFVKAMWAIALHDAVASYMMTPTSRAAIRDGLLGVYRACTASRITVSPTAVTVAQGAKSKLTARVANAYGDSLPSAILSWTSSKPSAASVDDSGMVTGGDPGPYQQYLVQVVARRNDVQASAMVTVTPALPTVEVTAYATPRSVMRVEGASGGSLESTSIYDGELPNNWTVSWDGQSACDQRTTLYHTYPDGYRGAVRYVQVCWFEYGFSVSGQPSAAGTRIDYYAFQWVLPDGEQLSGPWAGLDRGTSSYATRTSGYWDNGFDRMPWSGLWVTAVDDVGRRARPVFAPFTVQ